MIARAQELGVETVFDRAETMKPCNIGMQGTCCKNCAMGPCRLPLPKGGIEGEDTRKGLCGATANTIAARNFARMVAAGAAAHSDHGRSVAEVFLSVARKETDDYKIKDPEKLLAIAPHFGVATTVEVDGESRWIGILMKSPWKWRKRPWTNGARPEGELHYLKRAPQPLYEKWKKTGRAAPEHRPGDRRNHAPHPHGCGPGLQKHRSSSAPGLPWPTAGAAP